MANKHGSSGNEVLNHYLDAFFMRPRTRFGFASALVPKELGID